MWLFFTRQPQPDAFVWPGRHLCACLDAVGWPLTVLAAIAQSPAVNHMLAGFLVALTVLVSGSRLRRAIWRNERYRFTTWVAVRSTFVVLFIGWALKFTLT